MEHEDNLVAALAHAVTHDSSTKSLKRAIASLRAEHGVSQRQAYAMLVRANAGLPMLAETQLAPVQTSRTVDTPAAPPVQLKLLAG